MMDEHFYSFLSP